MNLSELRMKQAHERRVVYPNELTVFLDINGKLLTWDGSLSSMEKYFNSLSAEEQAKLMGFQ